MAGNKDLDQITGFIIDSNGSLTNFTHAQLTEAVRNYFNANLEKFPSFYSPLNIIQELFKFEYVKESSEKGLYSFNQK
ncbi:hypothetical protein HZA97_09360 [Candidatus Woesearchaeota archaeon]|nr:hypothetical protein [Candidatus Woesearchaeota archaeon]